MHTDAVSHWCNQLVQKSLADVVSHAACGVTGPFRRALGQIILGCFVEATVNALKKIPNSAQTIPQQFGPSGPTLAKLDP